MKEKLIPESVEEVMYSSVFGVEVTDQQMKEKWERDQAEEEEHDEWLRVDNERLAKLREVVNGKA